MPTAVHLNIESKIAAAHRALTFAAEAASALPDLGLHDDLQLITLELERLQVDLLKSARPRRIQRGPSYVSQTGDHSIWPHSPR